MRFLALGITSVALVVAPSRAGEMCVQEALSLCCHPNCDVPFPTTPAGFSADGSASCGAVGELTISSSSTDPFPNDGALEAPFGNLYLWATVGSGYGFSVLSAVTISGDLPLWQFTPLHPTVHDAPDPSGFPTTFTFSMGCLNEEPPTLLASMVVLNAPTSVEPRSWARVKALWR